MALVFGVGAASVWDGARKGSGAEDETMDIAAHAHARRSDLGQAPLTYL